MSIKVEFGMFGWSTDEKRLLACQNDIEGQTIDHIYRLFDNVQRDITGTVRRKLFIKPFLNDVQTSEDPLGDMTVIKDGDVLEFRRVPPPDYVSPRAKSPSWWTRLKWRFGWV